MKKLHCLCACELSIYGIYLSVHGILSYPILSYPTHVPYIRTIHSTTSSPSPKTGSIPRASERSDFTITRSRPAQPRQPNPAAWLRLGGACMSGYPTPTLGAHWGVEYPYPARGSKAGGELISRVSTRRTLCGLVRRLYVRCMYVCMNPTHYRRRPRINCPVPLRFVYWL